MEASQDRSGLKNRGTILGKLLLRNRSKLDYVKSMASPEEVHTYLHLDSREENDVR
jgi:hypothetical protein